MNTPRSKNNQDTDDVADGGRKFITTMLMFIGTVLFSIFFITFIFWLMMNI